MDIIQTIWNRVNDLNSYRGDYNFMDVLSHIERAANHLKKGVEEEDNDYFTDAVYRTNQAYEGALKQAYRLLTGKDIAKIRPYDIEKYLIREEVISSRVIFYLENYRREWRNPSTHNHSLNFNRSEAFLAVVAVCAFIYALVNQVIEFSVYHIAKDKLIDDSSTYEYDSGENLISNIVNSIIQRLPHKFQLYEEFTDEQNFASVIEAVISDSIPDVVMKRHFIISNKFPHFIADMLVEREGESSVLVEVRNGGKNDVELMHSYLIDLLERSDLDVALMIQYYATGQYKEPFVAHKHIEINGETKIVVHVGL